jgi:penicillin-binding protein 1C
LFAAALGLPLAAAAALVIVTAAHLDPPRGLRPIGPTTPRILARDGARLSVSYMDPWNVHDTIRYHEVPELLRDAFLTAEDKRFFSHSGVDWLARASAVRQAALAGRFVRGASTITEQVVRILNPRPRTLWSRWLEGFEARAVEREFEKAEIFECYVNQVPYGSNRRGVVQAARSYFNRDLRTLSAAEMLALAVLVRSPSRLDLGRGTTEIRMPLERLARRMHAIGSLDDSELASVLADPITVVRPRLDVNAGHFVRFVRTFETDREHGPATVRTTLDPSLQTRTQRILDTQIADLAGRGVTDGAVLVVDHTSDAVLAWVNGFGFSDRPGGQIDKVLTPRQPGSTLKPFVYALALESGWTAATIIDDAPLEETVGHGLHSYRNYSRCFYGPVRLREALGNSLNTAAVRTARFTGQTRFFDRLQSLGFSSLTREAAHYGDGLALGNGEVTLYELVRAYAAVARGGVLKRLRHELAADGDSDAAHRVFDPEVSSLIAHIMSDPEARSREFGRDSVLALPIQTAVKTGTSNDHRDAWAVGFSHRHTVGVWMGNIDGTPTEEVSGSQGPALVLRAVFAELNRSTSSRPLFLSRRLMSLDVCSSSGRPAGSTCPVITEWFRAEHAPDGRCPVHDSAAHAITRSTSVIGSPPRIASPTPGLHLAKDPRIPDEIERFPLRLADATGVQRTQWLVDGEVTAETAAGETTSPWPVVRGPHTVRAKVWLDGEVEPVMTEAVEFLVK